MKMENENVMSISNHQSAWHRQCEKLQLLTGMAVASVKREAIFI
jgi:hypothetical protein